MTSIEAKIDAAEKNLARLLEWVSRFDNKVLVVIGITTGMLGVLASVAPRPNEWTRWMILWGGLSILTLALSFLFTYWSGYPQLRGPVNSLLFFGSIRQCKLEEYKTSFAEQSAEKHLDDLLNQCHRNSEIIWRKFFWLRFAYRALFLSFVPWAIALYLFRSAVTKTP
jgi:hypothetical protein